MTSPVPPRAPLDVVRATADADLLGAPLRSLADIEAIETTPLETRLATVDVYQRIVLALESQPPEKAAISFVADGRIESPAETVSFGRLRERIERTSALLRSHGIGRQDVVAILLPTMPAIYWSIVGTMRRAIPFPLNWMLEPQHLFDLLSQAKVKAVIALGPTPEFQIWESLMAIQDRLPDDLKVWSVTGPGGRPLPQTDLDMALDALEEAQLAPDPTPPAQGHDVVAYLHSGGTTGVPKIVRLSNRNVAYRHWTTQLAMQIQRGEVVLQDTPVFHVGGFAGRCLPMLASGASLVIPSIMGARDKRYMANYWKFVERFSVTRLSGVPTMFSLLAKSPPQGEDLSSLHSNFMTGSTALPNAVRRAFEDVSGVRILNSYGLTENTATVAFELRDGPAKEGGSGVRAPYTEVRVVALDRADAAPRLCGPEESGMLQVRGPGVALGYLDPEHDRVARTDDGWLVTGDLGRVDAEGWLFVTGRSKDVIIRGGHNIDPGPIEEALLGSPEVVHAAAVGKPDAYAGELPVAYVQLTPGSRLTAEALIALAASGVTERPAIPKEVIILDRMPLTEVGKPIKTALRRNAAERVFTAALLEIWPSGAGLDVQVEPDAVHGSLVRITAVGVQAQGPLEAQVRTVMEQFAFAYEIRWS